MCNIVYFFKTVGADVYLDLNNLAKNCWEQTNVKMFKQQYLYRYGGVNNIIPTINPYTPTIIQVMHYHVMCH